MMTMPRFTSRRVRPRVPMLPLLRCACLGMVQA
jgi:hypothetical protein